MRAEDQTFTITPDKGYAVANVKIDGKSIGAVKSYTFENVRRTHTIEVIFMKANGNPQTGVFVDVATGSYYEDAVDWAVENGITKGTDDTHFSPDGICTRAQAVTFLWRAAGSPKPETRTMPFTDVPAGSYYYDAVLWAVENGITKGTSNTTFSPNMTCTRAQIVTFLWRSEKSPAAGTAESLCRCEVHRLLCRRGSVGGQGGHHQGNHQHHIQPRRGLHQSADRDLPLALQEVTG